MGWTLNFLESGQGWVTTACPERIIEIATTTTPSSTSTLTRRIVRRLAGP